MIHPHLTYAILAVWNWSLLQFCLAIGAAHKSRKTLGSGSHYSRQTSSLSGNCKVSRLNYDDQVGGVLTSCFIKCELQKNINADIVAIIFAIVLQDIPFICLRLTLILG